MGSAISQKKRQFPGTTVKRVVPWSVKRPHHCVPKFLCSCTKDISKWYERIDLLPAPEILTLFISDGCPFKMARACDTLEIIGKKRAISRPSFDGRDSEIFTPFSSFSDRRFSAFWQHYTPKWRLPRALTQTLLAMHSHSPQTGSNTLLRCFSIDNWHWISVQRALASLETNHHLCLINNDDVLGFNNVVASFAQSFSSRFLLHSGPVGKASEAEL
jgi:hypothetical protein